MLIDEEKEELIINCGVFEYPPRKIANILGVDLETVLKELSKEESKLNKLLNKGRDLADYVIDLKLFELAKTGDMKALDKLEKRKRIIKSQKKAL